MTYYAFIENNEINGCGQCQCAQVQNIEITQEMFNNIQDYIWDGENIVIDPELDNKKLQQAKDKKIALNDTLRDEALNQGVLYKDVLFDSDTDQKVNLLAIVSAMDDAPVKSEISTSPESSTSELTLDGSTPAAVSITWFGKDNQPLECNKEDLENIGALITQLHSFCWNKNALLKDEINNAQTIAELEEIEIDYTMEDNNAI